MNCLISKSSYTLLEDENRINDCFSINPSKFIYNLPNDYPTTVKEMFQIQNNVFLNVLILSHIMILHKRIRSIVLLKYLILLLIFINEYPKFTINIW